MRRRHIMATASAAAFACLLATGATAQDAGQPAQSGAQPGQPAQSGQPEQDNASLLDEVVVTAQKRSENLQSVPIAVTALSANALSAANVDGQITLPKVTPNVNFTQVSQFVSAYVRGVGTQFANPGLESSVSVYFDDSYVPRAGSANFSFNDIERIEVLKGPQGTLYGRNATGGAIRIITYDPAPEFAAAGSVTTGSDNRLAVDGMINLPLSDTLALRIAGRHDENDGFVRNILNGRRLMSRDADIVTAKLLYTPNDRLSIKLSGDYSKKDDTEGVAFANLYPGGPEQIGAALGGCVSTDFYNVCNNEIVPIQNYIEQYGVAARIDYDFGGLTLTGITTYRYETEYAATDLDATGADLQQAVGTPETKQFTQEFQIASSKEGRLSYLAGLFYLYEKSSYFFAAYGEGVGPGIALGGDGEVETNSFAPYVQADYRLTDALTLTAGLRYTVEEKKLLSNNGIVGPRGADGFPIAGSAVIAPAGLCTAPAQVLCEAPPASVDFKQFTPKLTLSYTPYDRVLLYATYARGFKSGGFNLPSFGAVDSVEPEILDDYEVGWKTQFGNLRWNGAAFYYVYDDLQTQTIDVTTGANRTRNAASAIIKGLETDVTWAPTNELELGLGGGYLDAHYDEYVGDLFISNAPLPGVSTVGGNDLSGNTLVNSPEFSGYVRGQYSFSLNSLGGLTLSAIANYRSRAYFDAGNQFEDPERLLVSARINWESLDQRYYVTLSGENLTDEQYNVSRVPQATGGWRTPAPPRQFYLQAGVKF